MDKIRVIQLNATALVWASGTLDRTRLADLHQALRPLLVDSVKAIVMDLATVEKVDAPAAAVLAATAATLGKRGGVVHLLLPLGHRAAVRDALTARQVLHRLYPTLGQAEAA